MKANRLDLLIRWSAVCGAATLGMRRLLLMQLASLLRYPDWHLPSQFWQRVGSAANVMAELVITLTLLVLPWLVIPAFRVRIPSDRLTPAIDLAFVVVLYGTAILLLRPPGG